MPPTPDLSYTGLDEFVNKTVAKNTKSSKEETKVVRKNDDAPIIEEWVSDDEEKNVTQPKIERKQLGPTLLRKKNPVDHKVNVIRYDNGTEFKNREMNWFCEMKGILRQFNVAITPQQNRVAEKRNMTLIEAARTMLTDSKLPTTFWAEAVNTAYYVQNRVLVFKPHKKTPYELFHSGTPSLSFMRPFGCLVSILNTIDHLGKFEGKADEGFFVGYSLNSKTFRVFNSRTKIVEENLHIRFSENIPNVVGSRPDWLFDIDALTRTMNYEPIVAGTQSNDYADGCQSALLYGKIKKEVYVCQPRGFNDPDFPDKVYKFEKALYGLHQAPKSWYETLSTYLLDNWFHKGKIDKALFIRRHKGDILLIQVYVDDIIFGSTKKELFIAFEKMMHEKFQMSSMGELTFFLRLQVKQKQDEIFISQDKYVTKILKKYGFTEVKNASTSMETQKPLLKDEDGEKVDVHMYSSGLLLRQEPSMGKHKYMPSSGLLLRQEPSMGKHKYMPRKAKKKDTQVLQLSGPTESVVDEAVYKELDDSLVRAATTASSLEAEQDSGGGPRCQEAIGNTIAQTSVLDLENTKTTQALEIDNLKRRVKKLEKKQRSRNHKLKRLYKVSLSARVESSDDNEDLGEDASKQGRISDINADQGITLVSAHGDAEMFDADKDLHGEEVFVAKQDENVVEKEVDVAQVQVSTAATTPTILIDEVTLDQALAELIHTKPKDKAKRIVFHEPEESTTTTTATISKPKSQDKGKTIIIEEPIKLKNKDKLMLDEEVALKLQAELQAEFDNEQRLASEKAQQEEEVNSSLIEECNDIQEKFDVDYLLAQRLKSRRRKEEQTTNTSSTKKNNMYLPQEYRRKEAQGFKEQVF
uniref:Ribonuclease H-like domain-containing protein n=1 Tax=Tanacetum cinerariifolium TaxID=118510 RepID=A0A6L2JDF6_TANCI|nr:ribonuclease H-like domain-containing protein [Tanacetum cinerariifolium]